MACARGRRGRGDVVEGVEAAEVSLTMPEQTMEVASVAPQNLEIRVLKEEMVPWVLGFGMSGEVRIWGFYL